MSFDFLDAKKSSRPIPFWSWNEKLNISETINQIEEMDKQGIGGFFMHARGGLETPYMEEEWFANVQAAIDKCKENGMIPWAYDENGWPSGFGNGKVCSKGVEYQQKILRLEKGFKETSTTIANVDGYHFYYEVNPFYVDVLDEKVTNEFIKVAYQPYYDKFKNNLQGFFTDEPQMTRIGIPWSFILLDEYKREYGEELKEVLPQLFFEVDDYKQTRMKFWRLITILFSKNFVKKIYDWCQEHGYMFTGHFLCEETLFSQLTPNGACMPHYEYMSIPGMDWLGRHNTDMLTPYQVASVARQLGKKQVLSETFALCGHNVGHDELKWMYEHQMVRGINLLCQHLQGYSLKGIRKRDYPPAMYIQQPWWDDYKMFNDAMSRIGELLSGGDDGVDVLVIHPQTTAWTMYNDSIVYDEWNIPWETDIMKLHKDFMDVLIKLEKKHINFHLGDEIIMERHAKVEGNKVVIGNKKYSRIILPRHEILFENTRKILEEFKHAGGSIVSVEEIPENNIIDIPEITYCERKYKHYTIYYFVNSTENTYEATIKKGCKILNVVSGEVYPFYGKYVFHKYESLVVIDDNEARIIEKNKKTLTPVSMSGEWDIKSCSDNILTLDYCDYYFDDTLIEHNGYVLNAMYRAVEKKKTKVRCDFKFTSEYIPENLCLVCEQPERFNITINGKDINNKTEEYFVDKSFSKLNISEFVKLGENTISMEIDFKLSNQTLENLEKAEKFESEKNKLTFEVEIEQIYLVGDFSVKTENDFEMLDRNACRYNGSFVISSPQNQIKLTNIEQQGFPFFSGQMTVTKQIFVEDVNMELSFMKCGINVVKAKVNGIDVSQFMWEPYKVDISSYLKKGDINEIELTLVNNLRNMQGPFHLKKGESYLVTPADFYKEKCVWFTGELNDCWNDDYCFVNVSISNR